MQSSGSAWVQDLETMDAITVVTPVYFNVPERWDYFETTIDSFYRCCEYQGEIIHNLVDDRSPLFDQRLVSFCEERGFNLIKRIDPEQRKGFFEVVQTLVMSVQTEYFIYLEPDHFFYLPYDFVTPVIKLYRLVPNLHQVYLRAPLTYDPFRLVGEFLVTYDQSKLVRVRIDQENTGWIGRGRNHESFSFMPSVFHTATLRQYIENRFIPGNPADVEIFLAREWEFRHVVGYLNAQAFCYHIGKAGKRGPGGCLEVGDKKFEQVWSRKIL